MATATVYMRNNDAYANQVKAWDANDGNNPVWDGVVAEHSQPGITVVEDDVGFCNVITSTDGNPNVGHSLLKDGDVFDI
jgi:hypothetical protein